MGALNRIVGFLLLLGGVLFFAMGMIIPLFALVLWPIGLLLFILGLFGLISGDGGRAARLEQQRQMEAWQQQQWHQQQAWMAQQAALQTAQHGGQLPPSFQAVCPQCQMVVVHDGSLAGKVVSCGRCGSQFAVQ